MASDLFDIRDDGTVVLRLHVQPGAGRTAVAGRHGDALKVRVAAPPSGGRANDACVALVAEVLGVQEADVELVGGPASRSKRVAVKAVEADEAARRLELALTEAGDTPGSAPRGRARRGSGRR